MWHVDKPSAVSRRTTSYEREMHVVRAGEPLEGTTSLVGDAGRRGRRRNGGERPVDVERDE